MKAGRYRQLNLIFGLIALIFVSIGVFAWSEYTDAKIEDPWFGKERVYKSQEVSPDCYDGNMEGVEEVMTNGYFCRCKGELGTDINSYKKLICVDYKWEVRDTKDSTQDKHVRYDPSY